MHQLVVHFGAASANQIYGLLSLASIGIKQGFCSFLNDCNGLWREIQIIELQPPVNVQIHPVTLVLAMQ